MKNKYVDLEVLNHGLKELATKINSVFRKIKDSYTKTEIDDKFTSIAKGMNWKPSVATKVDLEALTDNSKSDTRIVEDESKIYIYNGTSWEGIGSSANVPKATINNDGLMSKEDFTKLEGIEPDKYETKEDFNTKVGSLTSLNTDNKDSVVSAINEVKEGVNNTVKIDDTVVDTNKVYSSKKINDTYVKKEENKSLVPDSEIEKIHTHTNKNYLDKISENAEGKPLYNGNIIGDDLKPATKNTLGGIKVGDNLEITNEGILSATKVSEIDDTKLADNSTYSSNKINNTYVAKEEGKSLVENTEISKIHEHNNKAYLDKLGENESGKPTYNGEEIGTGGSGVNIDDTNISTDTTYSSKKIEDKFVGEIEGYTDDELKAMLGLSEDDKDLIKNLITDDSVIDTTKTWNSSVLNKKFNNIKNKVNGISQADYNSLIEKGEVDSTVPYLVTTNETLGTEKKALLYYNNQLYNFTNPSTDNNEIQQKVSLNATKNNSVEIATADSNNKLMIENYKFIKGTENTTSIIKKFNNSNKDNFIYNPDEIDFDDNNTCVKNKYVYDMKANSDGLYESEVINKNDFLEIKEVI